MLWKVGDFGVQSISWSPQAITRLSAMPGFVPTSKDREIRAGFVGSTFYTAVQDEEWGFHRSIVQWLYHTSVRLRETVGVPSSMGSQFQQRLSGWRQWQPSHFTVGSYWDTCVSPEEAVWNTHAAHLQQYLLNSKHLSARQGRKKEASRCSCSGAKNIR